MEIRRKRPLFARLLLVGTTLITALAVAAVVLLVWQSRNQALRAGAVTTQNLARLLDEDLTASFDKVELALLAVKDELERQEASGRKDPAALQACLLRQKERAPDALSLRVIDEHGDLSSSAPPTSEAHHLGDREYFWALRDGAPHVVSKPFSGRVIPAPVTVIARRLEHRDGSFAGAVIGALDLNHVATMLARPDVGPEGVVVLRGEDLQVMARTDSRGAKGVVDASAVSDELKGLVASGRSSGTYEALAPSDGTLRTLSFRRLDHHPFFIIVGVAHDDRLADWRRETRWAVALLLGFVALAACGALLAVRAWRRQALAEERLEFAIEAATDVVWDWNLEADTLFQPRWAKAYGYPQEATPTTGQELARYVHPEDLPLLDEAVRLAAGGVRDRVEFEHRVRAASGEWRWTLARGRVVARDAHGKATRIIGTCADITDRKLMMAKLHMADRMASVGTLAAGIAHEINNPLAYVAGNVEYAIELLEPVAALRSAEAPSAPGAAATECITVLRDVQEGAERVRQIVRDLKVFSRSDEEQRTPVPLAKAIQGALKLAEADIRYRARLVTRLAELPPVLANEARLSQVFLNLLLNAAQAIPEGRPDANQITVETRLDPPGRAVAEVSDTGAGIPPDVLKRIFDPFFTTKPVGVGTGLGLTICHSIVTGLGGDIEVTSEVGKGTTFRITLPVTGSVGLRESLAPTPP
jgi:PAS domain S-box-containing protein